MNFWWTCLATVVLILSCKAGLVIINDNDPGQCDQSNHGTQALVKDRENKEQILTCTEDNGVYQWKIAGGDDPIGERFSPGFDCSKILNSNLEAKDGMYWIDLGGYYPKQVYCDMTTDGGGYILVGRKNSSVTWTVPSNDIPVEPYGDPHWASNLGEAPILDFRVQMAKDEDLTKTIAHWSFRLQSERPLKNLMIMDKGCAKTSPGIGNIAYVKDLQTESIVTTNFRCSVFGGYHHPLTGFGWNMMNSCLNKPCRRGFAFYDHDVINLQTDHSGSFSYSVSGSTSGYFHNATAFVGCDKMKCCGCFGSVGGTDDYCGTDCTKANGGTIMKNVYTWFWVRTSIPKKVWSKCMDYKVTIENGDTVWYKLLNGNTTPEKGRCGQSDALLNDGIVVVPDAETGKKVPAVPGLIEYRKDSKELYVRANETWNVVPQEKEVLKKCAEMVEPRLKQFEEKLQQVIDLLNTDIAELKTGLMSNITEVQKDIGNMNYTLNNLMNSFTGSFADSAILSGEPESFQNYIKEWLPKGLIKATLCWRASRDGWASSTFHYNCDYQAPTLTIIKVGGYIFGGYTEASWSGSGYGKRSPGSFIFSLRNNENIPPFKAPLYNQNDAYAIYTNPSYGPTFGGGHDIYISDDASSNTNSYTGYTNSYQPPSGVSSASTILAGSYNFSPSEVEVFYLV